jgi:hypothetical protein
MTPDQDGPTYGSLERFLTTLIQEYRREFEGLPGVRDTLVKPIAHWLLSIEGENIERTVN